MESVTFQQSFPEVIEVFDNDRDIGSIDNESGLGFLNFLDYLLVHVKIEPLGFGEVSELFWPLIHSFTFGQAVHDIVRDDRRHEPVHWRVITGSARGSVLEKYICT